LDLVAEVSEDRLRWIARPVLWSETELSKGSARSTGFRDGGSDQKLGVVRDRRYITPGFVKSLTSFFLVPKGQDDVHMVYDGTVSGLNDSIWVPRFLLPTIETHLRAVDEGTHMADVDVAECFLNFILHPELRELAGVDLSHYFGDEGEVKWEVWDRGRQWK
jgi:hypothetical protein